MAQMVAMLHDDETQVILPAGASFPFRTTWVAGQLYLVSVPPAERDLLGAQILAGPKPSSVRDHSADIMHAAARPASRIAELIVVPEPVWPGFERAVAVRLAEKYGRAGRKVSAEVGLLVKAGHVARIIDQGRRLRGLALAG